MFCPTKWSHYLESPLLIISPSSGLPLIPFHPFIAILILIFLVWETFWIMESNRRERDENITVVSKPYCILCDDCQISTTSTATSPFVNLLIALQSLETAPEEVTALVPCAQAEATLDGLGGWPVSEGHPMLRIKPTQSRSSALLEDVVRNQFESIPAIVEGIVVRLLVNAGLATESVPSNKVLVVIRPVLNRSVAKGLPMLCLLECGGTSSSKMPVWSTSCKWSGDLYNWPPDFTVPKVKFVRNEAARRSP